jgi:hypothetical protein
MGKIVFWLLVVFAALLVLRLVNASKQRARADAARDKAQDAARRASAPADGTMVRCAKCGTFVPQAEALPAPGGGFTCGEPGCGVRR